MNSQFKIFEFALRFVTIVFLRGRRPCLCMHKAVLIFNILKLIILFFFKHLSYVKNCSMNYSHLKAVSRSQ